MRMKYAKAIMPESTKATGRVEQPDQEQLSAEKLEDAGKPDQRHQWHLMRFGRRRESEELPACREVSAGSPTMMRSTLNYRGAQSL
jgi:hypothetical protein